MLPAVSSVGTPVAYQSLTRSKQQTDKPEN